jgi:outer membrane protein OmpA-like peptidoglycan-associated protein
MTMNAKTLWILNVLVTGLLAGGVGATVHSQVSSAAHRLETGESVTAKPKTAPLLASTAEVGYCTEEMKTVLRRVLTNCGLIGGGRRGCQPNELKQIAQIDDGDFNALFKPLDQRASILLFDPNKDELDPAARQIIERQWADQRGASYFFILGRASTDGPTDLNQKLSHRRVNSVLFYLQERFPQDSELEQKVGLLWLGEEYAQLGADYCGWQNNRPGQPCDEEKVNRSVILSWIDCRL